MTDIVYNLIGIKIVELSTISLTLSKTLNDLWHFVQSQMPGRHQAIIWTNAGILLIRTLGINFSEILIEFLTFSFNKMRLKCRLEIGGHFVSASMI